MPPFDLAIFVDDARRPVRISADLAQVQQVAIKAGVPILRLCCAGSPTEVVSSKVREILGHPPGSPLPGQLVAEVDFGICLDQIHLAAKSESADLRYTYPLVELGWTRRECSAFLRSLHLGSGHGTGSARRGWAL
ncbi:hypothetical protein ACRYCC_10245 [Actinomadura scrupuli]|uniref:hypothetical protein n=1 Tax=Actinomadura scrupuli TaxID=559629 RepID=UPI003D9857CD